MTHRVMPDKFNLGQHMASCVGQAMHQQKNWMEYGSNPNNDRMVMGYKLPTWQRPFVWTEAQSIKLIESIWKGIDIGTYTFNRTHDTPHLDDLLIDGQQRMRAIEMYLSDGFKVFGYLWSEVTPVDRSSFDGRHFHCFITSSVDEEYLKGYYNMMNFSGTSHTEDQRT